MSPARSQGAALAPGGVPRSSVPAAERAAGGPTIPPQDDAGAASVAPRVPRLGRYVLGRLLQGVVVVIGAVVISFLLLNVSGNPSDVLGTGLITNEEREEIAQALGYDQPLGERFVDYLADAFRGDLGISYRTGESALGAVLAAFPSTAALVAAALTLALLVSIPVAVYSALHRESLTDRVARRSLMLVGALPDYWVSLVLILVFAVTFNILPSTGFDSPASLILPSVAIALVVIPSLVRLLRGALLDTLEQDFVTTLRAKGFPESRIVYRFALRHAMVPFLTLLGLQIGWLLGGALIVEVVFAWPGIGSLLIEAVNARDYTIVQATVIVVATAYVVVNLMVDLAVIALDPRVRIGR